jgi:hypothetical protein
MEGTPILRRFQMVVCPLTDDTTAEIRNRQILEMSKDVTKTGEDRRIALCPRAVAIIERQLRSPEREVFAGLIRPLTTRFFGVRCADWDLKYAHWRWQ